MDWNESLSVEDSARERLPEMMRGYFAEGRELLDGSPEPAELHQFRLATKRVRYTLELFADLYDPGFAKRLLPDFKRLQTYLGDINDCAATRSMLKGAPPRERKTMKTFLERRQKREVSAFLRFWREEFDAPGKEDAWVRALARPLKPSPNTSQKKSGRRERR